MVSLVRAQCHSNTPVICGLKQSSFDQWPSCLTHQSLGSPLAIILRAAVFGPPALFPIWGGRRMFPPPPRVSASAHGATPPLLFAHFRAPSFKIIVFFSYYVSALSTMCFGSSRADEPRLARLSVRFVHFPPPCVCSCCRRVCTPASYRRNIQYAGLLCFL